MKDFWEKIKASLAGFMQGRHGGDELGMAMLIVGLVLSILQSLTGFTLFGLISMALYVWAIYRMMSRDDDKRSAENRAYQSRVSGTKKKVTQWTRRVKNSKEYKYCRCPKCKVLYRVKRGTGEKHIVCRQCKEEFDVKA